MAIKLFDPPKYTIDTSEYDNLLHGKVVEQFEEEFVDYVGGLCGISVDSCTNAIFLIAKYYKERGVLCFGVPGMIPPVVINALKHSGVSYTFLDNPTWMGGTYELRSGNLTITDSAQCVSPGQCCGLNGYVFLYSFYPTKPVAGMDGGMVVTDDVNLLRWLQLATVNGTGTGASWNREQKMTGWKAYMNSAQCDFALRSLRALPEKKRRLSEIRKIYTPLSNYRVNMKRKSSDHLYVIKVRDRSRFMASMNERDIQCGIHYKNLAPKGLCPQSDHLSHKVVSIPYHENLTDEQAKHVVRSCLANIN